MQEIKDALKAKFDEWVESITDETVKAMVKVNTIITGGAIVSYILGEKVKDYDIYFKDKLTALAVANYYVNKFNASNPHRKFLVVDGDNPPPTDGLSKWKRNLIKDVLPGSVRIICLQKSRKKDYDPKDDYSNEFDHESDTYSDNHAPYIGLDLGVDSLEPVKAEPPVIAMPKPTRIYKPVFLSHNAITLSDKMQLITRFYGSAEQIHKNFDFVHCTNFWDSATEELHIRPEAMAAIADKQLRYIGSKFPLCSAFRVDKFAARGWSISQEEWTKIALQILALDLEDPKRLKEQLAGYYSNLFNEMSYEINCLKEQYLDEEITADMILEIINDFI